jgi:TetR/AcrR family acrAB operon transcriptional repressor
VLMLHTFTHVCKVLFMVRRTKKEAETTRNQLLDAAEAVFNQKGVAHSSLADIAATAGVTRGAIYWHFRNKADLFHAMLERVKMPLDEMIGQLSSEQLAEPLAFIRKASLRVLSHIATDAHTRCVFDIAHHKCEMVDEMAVARERRLEGRAGCLNQIEEAVRAAIQQGTLPKTLNPHTAAIGLHALIDGLTSNWVLHPDSFSLIDEAGSLIDIYLAGLANAQ